MKRYIVTNYLGLGDIVASFDIKEDAIKFCSDKDDCLWYDTENDFVSERKR